MEDSRIKVHYTFYMFLFFVIYFVFKFYSEDKRVFISLLAHYFPHFSIVQSHLDFIILPPSLGTKSGLSLVGWLADSWLKKQLSHSHLSLALVQGPLQQWGVNRTAKCVSQEIHYSFAGISQQCQSVATWM